MNSLSVLFLHSSDECFGSDRVVLSAIDAAAGQGHRVRVLLPDDREDGWLTDQLRQRGIELRKATLAPARRRYFRPRSLPTYAAALARARRGLRQELARSRIDVLYVNTTALPVAALVRRSDTRLIWHVHELVVSPRPVAWLLRVVPMLAADDVVAISEAVATNLRRSPVSRAKIHRIYNGIPTRPVAGLQKPAGPRLCVFVGRLLPWKGYQLFVEAASDLVKEFADVRFLVVGTPVPGEEWRIDDLARQIEDLDIGQQVEMVGMCDDVPTLLDGAHVVAVPSLWPEPLGLVTLEAMRSGCAVVVSDHGGSREIVTHGVDGLVVTPGSRSALAGALGRLLRDEPLRQRIAREGQQRVKDAFSEATFQSAIATLFSRRAH